MAKYDDFNDNSRDATFWDVIAWGTGSVAEQNQRLECTCPASADGAGYVTKYAYVISALDAQVDVDNDALSDLELLICLTKTVNSNPYDQAEWYRIMKYNRTDLTYVQRRVGGGTPVTLWSGTWTGPTGYLRIKVSGGTIYFYEETNLRYSESYALASTTCYIYIFGYGYTGFLGMDYFDNFQALGIAVAHYLAVSEILGAVDSAARSKAMRLTVSEILGMSDSALRTAHLAQTVSEVLGMRDGVEIRKHVGRLGDLPDHYREGGA